MKITPKILVAILVLSLTPLVLTAYLVTANATLTLEGQVLNQLDAVASVQKSRLDDSIAQDLERLALVSSRTQLRISLDNYTRDPQQKYVDQMNRILLDARSSVASFRQVHVLVLNGTIVASTDPAAIGTNHSTEEFFLRGRTERTVDIFFLNATEQLGVYLSGPLTFNNTAIGVLVIESGVENVLSMVEEYSGLGESGETNLAERTPDGGARFLAPTRFDPYAALNRTISGNATASPLIMALAGEETLFAEATDYRGVRVLAATRYISQTGWGLVVKIDRSEAFAPVVALQGLMIAIIGLSSAVIAALSVYVARSIARPIRDVAEVAGRISEGELDRRVDIGSKDEIGELARSFNEMTQKLVESNLDLERKVRERTAKVEEEMGQRTRAEEALRLHAAEREAQVRKEETERLAFATHLAAYVAHELNTPLANIALLASTAKRSRTPEELAERLGRIDDQRRRATQIIQDILRLGQGQTLRTEQIDLRALVEEASTQVEVYRHPAVVFETRLGTEGALLTADRAQLRQVFVNLLKNALQATSQGTVCVELEQAEQSLKVTISDTGSGMNSETLSRLFQPFFTTKELGSGTGLGLTFCKALVTAHGGEIRVASEPGQGTRFTVVLPRKSPEARVTASTG